MSSVEKMPPADSAALASESDIAVNTASLRSEIASDSLLGQNGEVKINHNGEIYSLRKTRNGKLILTK